MAIKAFWFTGVKNVGDTLTVPLLNHFGFDVELVERNTKGKLLAVGSIMVCLRQGDTVWGTGCMNDRTIVKPNCRFLAVRGKLTRAAIGGSPVPEVYGDPALLLPLLYDPDVPVVHDTGVIPHFLDKDIAPTNGHHFIDVQADWKDVVREIKSCRKVISSSLHGIVIAEAYGVPAEWARFSDRILGGDFKFQDYFSGTGREPQRYGPLEPIEDLAAIQNGLIEALKGLDGAIPYSDGGHRLSGSR